MNASQDTANYHKKTEQDGFLQTQNFINSEESDQDSVSIESSDSSDDMDA